MYNSKNIFLHFWSSFQGRNLKMFHPGPDKKQTKRKTEKAQKDIFQCRVLSVALSFFILFVQFFFPRFPPDLFVSRHFALFAFFLHLFVLPSLVLNTEKINMLPKQGRRRQIEWCKPLFRENEIKTKQSKKQNNRKKH